MAMNKRKTTTAIVAGVTAAVLLLGGTFAWTSISQRAMNETAGIVNVGGRLHDDFDGTNKDVYVENFTDPYDGGQPIYARIKLSEYMEVGQDAGSGAGVDGDNDGKIEAVPVIAGTTIDNDKDWKVFIPDTITGTEITCGDCNEQNGLCGIHDHWKWTVSGGKTYMPTFNKDKDSLAADINGTYHGTDDTDKVYYDDYVVYTTTEQDGVNNNVAEADKEAYEGSIYSVIGTAYYDDDTNIDENDHANQLGVKVETETHTAKETATATVMTMQAWIDAGSQLGNYWVYDTDGWAYWANPIMPGEATGLLLDGIEMYQNPGEKCYYAINVVGQFATVNDWEQFGVDETDEDYPSDNAIDLLTKASQNIPTVIVTNVDGVTLVKRGNTVDFSVSTAVDGVSALANDQYEWVVLNENRDIITSSTVKDNGDGTATLTVGSEELSEGLYVAARSKSTGAVGMSAVAVQLYTVTVTEQNGATEVYAGDSLQFSAQVADSITGNAETSGVTWSVSGGNGKSEINAEGVLTVDGDEAGGAELTVTATSANGSFTETYTVTVGYELTLESTGTFDMADGLRVDIKEPYYSIEDISATFSDDITADEHHTPSNTKFNYAVKEDANGVYLLITHDDESYEFANHGTRRLTVDAAGFVTATLDFTCNCHTNTDYTVDTDGITEIVFADFAPFQVKLMDGDVRVEDRYITWNATSNSASDGTYLDADNSNTVYLDANEYSPYVRITYRTENAWGIKDLRIRYAETEEVQGMKIVLFRDNDPSYAYDTVLYRENRESNGAFRTGYVHMYRVYDKDGNIIDEPLNLSIWTGDRNITFNPTGQEGVPGTNGYVDAEGSSMQDGYGNYWIWTVSTNTSATPVTFWISYENDAGEVGTYEATVW